MTKGISDAPTFSQKPLLKDTIFDRIKDLKGGEYHGYLPIIQGDNARPHTDAEFNKFVKDHCEEHGLNWEPQATHMPHADNFDLPVFPPMSKRRSSILKAFSNIEAPLPIKYGWD